MNSIRGSGLDKSKYHRHFFARLVLSLGHKDSGKEAKASAKRWRLYGTVLGLGAEVFAGTRRIAILGLAVIASLSVVGILRAFFDVLFTKIVFAVGAVLSLILFTLLTTSDRVARAVAKYFSSVAEIEEKSLEEIKADLSGSLAKLGRPMLVVVDDVDRLSGPEMMLLFQLLKAYTLGVKPSP